MPAIVVAGFVAVLALLSGCDADGSTSSDATAGTTDATSATAVAPTRLTFQTEDGPIMVKLDPAAPRTGESMTTLAGNGYFDGTTCHRLVIRGIYVLQCGDPTGSGSGGPGYTLPDENIPAAGANNYPAGTVAMANRGGPNTGGSQFFIVYRDSTLGPNHTIWGTVTEGLDVVRDVARSGVVGGLPDGTPYRPLTFTSVTAS